MRMTGTTSAPALVALMMLTGCGSSAKPVAIPSASHGAPSTAVAPPAPTASPSSSASSPQHARFAKPYLNAFEDFLVAYTRADEHADPGSAELGQFSTGQALAWARKQVTDHRTLGVAHQGVWHFRSVGAVDVTPRGAQVGQLWGPKTRSALQGEGVFVDYAADRLVPS